MYFYFSSNFQSALKLNGIYYGIINDNVKSIDIDLPNKTLVEVLPLNGNYNGANFLLTDDFLLNPSLASVIDLKGGYFIKFNFSPINGDFNVLLQEKHPDAVVTVFIDGGLKLSIETPNGFFSDSFDFVDTNVKISRFYMDGYSFISVVFSEKNLYIYELSNGVKKVFCESVDAFSFENGLYTEKSYKDIAKHAVKTFWGYDGNALTVKDRTVSFDKDFIKENLSEKIIPYAFLEEFLVGGDFSYYLTKNVVKNADKLKGYFGDFIGIMPPPKFRKVNEIGLLYKIKENFYNVEYFTFSFLEGKINNVKKSDG